MAFVNSTERLMSRKEFRIIRFLGWATGAGVVKLAGPGERGVKFVEHEHELPYYTRERRTGFYLETVDVPQGQVYARVTTLFRRPRS